MVQRKRYQVLQKTPDCHALIVVEYDDRWAALRTCDLFMMEEMQTKGDAYYYVYDTHEMEVIKND